MDSCSCQGRRNLVRYWYEIVDEDKRAGTDLLLRTLRIEVHLFFVPSTSINRSRLKSFPMPVDELKTESHAELGSIDSADNHEVSERYGTVADQRDMYRMGKTQKLRVCFLTPGEFLVLTIDCWQRNFGFFSIFGFSMILLSTWETQLG